MPYKSKAQSAFMHSQHPEIAAKWDTENPDQDIPALPQHVKSRPVSALHEALRRHLALKGNKP